MVVVIERDIRGFDLPVGIYGGFVLSPVWFVSGPDVPAATAMLSYAFEVAMEELGHEFGCLGA